MSLLPRTLDSWFNDDSTDGGGFVDEPAGGIVTLPVRDNGDGILAGARPDLTPRSGINFLMEPGEIATVPGLPEHYYNSDAAEAPRVVAAAANSQAAPGVGADNPDGDGAAALERDTRNLSDEAVDRSISAVKGQGNSTTYTRADGRTYRLYGTIPNRDNNPLNVTSGAFARNHGAIGRDGRFAIFGSPADGFNAAKDNFDRLTREGSMPQYPTSNKTWDFWSGTAPLNTLVTMWSPPGPPGHPENDTNGMIRDITRGAHLNPGDNWGDLTDVQKWDFVHSYARREGYKGGW